MSTPIILASASPRRSDLLRELQLEFEVLPSEVDEIEHEHLTARELAQINAYRKARVVSKKFPDAIVIGVDTLVTVDARVLGKPRTLKEAQEMLLSLQGRSHMVYTGVCITHLRLHSQIIFAEKTRVLFKPLTAQKICAYHTLVNPLDKAGGYAIQEHGDEIVQEIDGSYSNVVGLPLERLQQELVAFGVELAAA